ncbi:MAG: hypothetical protein ACXWN4_04710, partial [Candidatus Limnocylindrales bacterium]
VARAQHDEGALLGQAEALTITGQRVDAALALDHVSEIQEATGRLPEAADTLRRALELEDAPERTRRQRCLLREIRLSAGDAAAEKLLARALRLRDEPAGDELETARPAVAAAPAGGPGDDESRPAADVAVEIPVPAAAEEAVADDLPDEVEETGEVEEVTAAATVDVGSARSAAPVEDFVVRQATEVDWPKEDRAPKAAARAHAAEPAPWPAAEHEPVPMAESVSLFAALDGADVVSQAERVAEEAQEDVPAVGVMEGAFDTAAMGEILGDGLHQPTGDELLASAEVADQAGDGEKLRSLLVWTARAYGREGRFEAGLDATHRLLQSDPSNVDAHLVLVELYLARGWNALAAEKLVLLGRLADLDDDQETRKRLCAVASRAFPDDEHLATLCA